ncbi:MAG: phosphate ABC transporter substrate-binding protein PstS [Xanthomonadaceae bacterium]|nr:phosphate ABC transporter substrate-binding protein PstS [Xanthomonadaceae bacterium]
MFSPKSASMPKQSVSGKPSRKLRTVLLAAALVVAGSATAATTHLIETGSSLLYPLFNLWVPAWTANHPEVRIDTASTGSGTGIAQSIEGIAQFGASDAYLSDVQMKRNPGMLNIPVAISSQMINYNVPGLNDKHIKLDGPVIAGMYDGSIRYWDDARVKALNPGLALPHKTVVAVHRADGSGDTFMFTQFLSFSTPAWNQKVAYGTTVSWPSVPGAIGATGNPGMVTALANTPYSIAYVGVSFKNETDKAKLGEAMLKNRAGKFVLINARTVPAAAAAMVPKTPKDQRISMVYAPGEESYPIINYEYVIVKSVQPNAEAAKQMRDFLTWAVSPDGGNAPKFLDQVHFLPLPASARALTLAQIKEIH